jgi:hypothetical protein
MAWWDQKTGSKPATGTADMLPPTHTWTSLWTFSNRKLKSLKVGAPRIDRIVRFRGSSSGRSGSRRVRGGSSSVSAPGSRSLTSSSSAGGKITSLSNKGLGRPSSRAWGTWVGGSPSWCAVAEVQSHHGMAISGTRSCNASSKKYR